MELFVHQDLLIKKYNFLGTKSNWWCHKWTIHKKIENHEKFYPLHYWDRTIFNSTKRCEIVCPIKQTTFTTKKAVDWCFYLQQPFLFFFFIPTFPMIVHISLFLHHSSSQVRTLGFHPRNTGSIPVWCTRIDSVNPFLLLFMSFWYSQLECGCRDKSQRRSHTIRHPRRHSHTFSCLYLAVQRLEVSRSLILQKQC